MKISLPFRGLKSALSKVRIKKPLSIFGQENEREQDEAGLALFRELEKPKTLEEAVEKYPYLAEYIKKHGLEPFYVVDPSSLGTEADLMSAAFVLDLIYPLERGIFIHIKAGGEIGKYNIIEPEKPDREILDRIESVIAKLISERTIVADSIEEKEKVITRLFNEAIAKKQLNIPED